MARTVADLKTSVAGQLSGIDITQIEDINGAFERAARIFVQKAKIPETLGRQNITLYSGVTDYLVNTSIYGTNIIDVQPQGVNRYQGDFVYKKFQDDFDRQKNWQWQGVSTTFTYNNGVPIIRIVSSNTTPKIVLDSMNSVTGWTASGNASGLVLDQTFYYQAPGALRFNLVNAGSQGLLTKTITSTNLTSYLGVGVVFLAIEIPTTTSITSIGIKLGSSAGDYYTVSNTVSTLGSFTVGQFMLIPLDLAQATTTGTPDISKITYIQIYINYNGTVQTNVRCGNLFISLPTPAQLLYMTAGFFSVGGVVSNKITANSDILVLNDSAYTIYELECAIAALQNQGGATSDSTIARIDGILNGQRARNGAVIQLGLYDQYRSENPSESLRTVGNYYDNSSSYSQDI